MKKPNFLTKLFAAASLLLCVHTAEASSGKTHNTEMYDDCYSNGVFETTFNLHLTGFPAYAYYRTVIKLYKGDWVTVGLAGSRVLNEVQVDSRTSNTLDLSGVLVPGGVPVDFYTADFFSTTPTFTVTQNGAYRSTTTIQRYDSGTWTDWYTTELSYIYGALDQPPYTSYGDPAEIAMITELKIGSNFNYAINGISVSTPTFVTCSTAPLILNQVQNWMGNPGTATLTVEQGGWLGSAFTPTSSAFVNLNVGGNEQDLTSLFSLINYSGPLRITYQLPDDNCGGVYTPVVKTMTISVATATFAGTYEAYTSIPTGCTVTTTGKPLATTPTITAAMPTATYMPTFRCQLASAIGWEGATSVGITNFTVSNTYTIDVYEVNSAGNRGSAPSVYLYTSSGSLAGYLSFNGPESAGFDASNAPYFVDASIPADPTGSSGGGDYFKNYYISCGTSTVALANMSAKIFCVEVSQTPPSGCQVSLKSYFRIANNGTLAGKGARIGASGIEDNDYEHGQLFGLYPNPTKGELNISLSDDDANVSMVITDNLGKQVMSIDDIKAKNGNINIENLTAGIYFYTINKDNSIYRGKIIKQ